MQITPESSKNNSWFLREDQLISSLKKQPIIILVCIDEIQLTEYDLKAIFLLISNLISQGIKNIEIAWSDNKNWAQITKEIILEFKDISFGAASITNKLALNVITEIGFSYAMSPFLEENLIQEAKAIDQLLIPGVFSPSEFKKAMTLNCKILKLFPASSLGINYLSQLKSPLKSLPLVIAAGGLTIEDVEPWLDAGYDAIVLGKGLNQNKLSAPIFQKKFNKK